MSVERKIGAKLDELAHPFRGTAVGMEEEAAGEFCGGVFPENLEQLWPRIQAVKGGDALVAMADLKLPLQNLVLFGKRRSPSSLKTRIVWSGVLEHPPIQPDLADGSVRILNQESFEFVSPGCRAIADFPRVEAVTGKNPRKLGGELVNNRPVVGGGTIADNSPHADFGQEFGCPGAFLGVGEKLQVEMGIIKSYRCHKK